MEGYASYWSGVAVMERSGLEGIWSAEDRQYRKGKVRIVPKQTGRDRQYGMGSEGIEMEGIGAAVQER